MPAQVIGSDGKPLGRGGNIWTARPSQLTVIMDPAHPIFDKSVLLPVPADLKESIRTRGVQSAVCVRRNGPILEVVYGRDRTRAAQELESEGVDITIPVVTMRGSDLDAVMAMVAENCDRKTIGPVDRAFYAERLRRFGATDEQCAKALKVDGQTVRADKVILDLADPVVDEIRAGNLPLRTAKALATLTRDDQVKAVTAAKEDAARKGQTRVSADAMHTIVKPDAPKPPKARTVRSLLADPRFKAIATDRERALVAWLIHGDDAELSLAPDLLAVVRDLRSQEA